MDSTLVIKYMWVKEDIRKPTKTQTLQEEDHLYNRYDHVYKKEKMKIQHHEKNDR